MAIKVFILIVLLSTVATIESKSVRTKRSPLPEYSAAAVKINAGIYNQGANYLGGLLADQTVSETVGEVGSSCGKEGGCYRGYCWAGCDATVFNNEWCYTTRGYSQDFNYVRCDRDSDCSKCWRCAGSCHA